jgi:hypothetical protein
VRGKAPPVRLPPFPCPRQHLAVFQVRTPRNRRMLNKYLSWKPQRTPAIASMSPSSGASLIGDAHDRTRFLRTTAIPPCSPTTHPFP